jgi:serine/threonine protein kinase
MTCLSKYSVNPAFLYGSSMAPLWLLYGSSMAPLGYPLRFIHHCLLAAPNDFFSIHVAPQLLQVLACNRQIYALKRVRLANKDPEAIQGFIEEITLLKQLRNTPNIIQLVNAQARGYC